MHQTHFLELLNPLDVNGAPGAGGPARSEANRVAGFVEALSNAVDPAKAESGVHGFRPGDAGSPGTLLIKADKEFVEFVVMGFEPSAEVGGRRKECCHGFASGDDRQKTGDGQEAEREKAVSAMTFGINPDVRRSSLWARSWVVLEKGSPS